MNPRTLPRVVPRPVMHVRLHSKRDIIAAARAGHPLSLDDQKASVSKIVTAPGPHSPDPQESPSPPQDGQSSRSREPRQRKMRFPPVQTKTHLEVKQQKKSEIVVVAEGKEEKEPSMVVVVTAAADAAAAEVEKKSEIVVVAEGKEEKEPPVVVVVTAAAAAAEVEVKRVDERPPQDAVVAVEVKKSRVFEIESKPAETKPKAQVSAYAGRDTVYAYSAIAALWVMDYAKRFPEKYRAELVAKMDRATFYRILGRIAAVAFDKEYDEKATPTAPTADLRALCKINDYFSDALGGIYDPAIVSPATVATAATSDPLVIDMIKERKLDIKADALPAELNINIAQVLRAMLEVTPDFGKLRWVSVLTGQEFQSGKSDKGEYGVFAGAGINETCPHGVSCRSILEYFVSI